MLHAQCNETITYFFFLSSHSTEAEATFFILMIVSLSEPSINGVNERWARQVKKDVSFFVKGLFKMRDRRHEEQFISECIFSRLVDRWWWDKNQVRMKQRGQRNSLVHLGGGGRSHAHIHTSLSLLHLFFSLLQALSQSFGELCKWVKKQAIRTHVVSLLTLKSKRQEDMKLSVTVYL